MKLTIEIDMDNDAFAGEEAGEEVRRILFGVIDVIQTRASRGEELTKRLFDTNGNSVGLARLTNE